MRKIWQNPLVIEGWHSYFSEQENLSRYLNYLIFLAALLFLTWPKSALLRVDSPPFTFTAILIAMLIILAYLNFALGAKELSEEEYHTLWDWVTLSPLRIRTIVGGYLTLMVFHGLFFLIISLPIVLAAKNVSGISFAVVGSALGMLFLYNISYRIMGWLCLIQWERSEFLPYIVVRILYIFFVFFTGFLAPTLNPILALTNIISNTETNPVFILGTWEISQPQVSLLFHLLLALFVLLFIFYQLNRWKRSVQDSTSFTSSDRQSS